MAKMTTGMRMLAMTKATQGGNQNNYNSMGDGGRMSMMDAPEMRRRRDSSGRYMEGGDNNYLSINAAETTAHYPTRHEPPYLNRPSNSEGRRKMAEDVSDVNPYGGQPEVYRRQEEQRNNGEMRRTTDGKTSAGEINYNRPDGGYGNVSYFMHKTDPMNQKEGKERFEQPRQIGFQSNQNGLDKETVMEWVEEMEDGEGVRGGKYTWHQAQQYAMNMGITGQQRLLEFFWAMNAMYADFHKVGKKFGVDKPDFYAHLAKCFIEDPDAKDNKVEEYVKHIVKHN